MRTMRAPDREGKSGSWNCCPIVQGIKSPCMTAYTPCRKCYFSMFTDLPGMANSDLAVYKLELAEAALHHF